MTYLISKNKECCSGCGACVNICNHNALHFLIDNEGFMYPEKDSNCINCGLCVSVCPYSENGVNLLTPNPKVYASYSKKERTRSSSGGVFYVIAKHIIESGGVVYGAAFSQDLKLRHQKAATIVELESLRGSKYIQSDLQLTFKEIKKQLIANNLVLFSGTPCQVAGLKSYLCKDYDKLITLDVVCDGVPSQWMFDKHREFLEQKHSAKLVSYAFRDNKGWSGCEIAEFETIKGIRKTVVTPTYEISPFLYSFLYGYTYRYSCYRCKFAKIPRRGDITLGDFWGIEKYKPKMDKTSGVSVILVNSEKGCNIWNIVKSSLIYEESTLQEACRYNSNIYKSHENIPSIRTYIYEKVCNRGYGSVARNEFRSPNYYNLKIKYFLKRYKIFRRLFDILKGR